MTSALSQTEDTQWTWLREMQKNIIIALAVARVECWGRCSSLTTLFHPPGLWLFPSLWGCPLLPFCRLAVSVWCFLSHLLVDSLTCLLLEPNNWPVCCLWILQARPPHSCVSRCGHASMWGPLQLQTRFTAAQRYYSRPSSCQHTNNCWEKEISHL